MRKTLLNNKRLRINLIICLGIILFISGCYEIKYIIIPDTVDPSSAFNVKICVQMSDFNRSDSEITHGVVGILLPEGWTVKDSIKYSLDLGEPYVPMHGFFCYNDTVVSFLDSCTGQCPNGYYWWGAKSTGEMSLFLRDSAYVDITILTDSKVGEYKTKFMVGDDSHYAKEKSGDPFGIIDSSDFIPIQVVATDVLDLWQNEDWKVYPNPSSGELFIRQDDLSGEVSMRIYDINGRLQKSALLLESLSKFDLSKLPKGTYLVALEKHGKVKTKKLILQ